MAKPVQTFSRLVREIFIAIVVNGALVLLGMLRFDWKIALLFFALTPFFIYYRYQRFFKMMTTSTLGYYYSFDSKDNMNVYREAKEKIYYLGISANSIIEYIRHWAEQNTFPGRCRFLLMDPDSMEALVEQKRFERGICMDEDSSLSGESLAQLRRDARIEADRIRSAIETLQTIDELQGKIEIRLYNEFIPWWMYMVDEKKIYMGILRSGRRGQDSSVMTLKKNENFASPFDPMKYKWDSLWRNSKPFDQ